MKEDTDQSMVQTALRGDRDAFGLLIERYEKPIFNVAYRITGSRDDAMDATQTAFTRAYEHLERFDPSRRFFSWIYRIAVNAALDLVKNRVGEELPEPLRAREAGPEERLQARETSSRVQEALLELSGDHRAVVVLRHYLGLSYAEISQVISVPVKTVRSRLYQARQRLRDLLIDVPRGH